jgi:hypothetical protein
MNKTLIIFLMIGLCHCSYAQESTVEADIRNLEQLECKAALGKDTAMLRKLWSHDYTVNSPANRVVKGGRNTLDRPVITQADNESFTRVVEYVLIKEDCAVTMGNEVVVPRSTNGAPSVPIKRRYTNIWKREKGQWKMFARHANVICE